MVRNSGKLEMILSPILEVVVTARPSWARVKTLVAAYSGLFGINQVRLSLVGPAVSSRYGDISNQIPAGVEIESFPTLRESDDLSSIALSAIDGSASLSRYWASRRPDCVLVVADRTETLGVSVAAALMQIPLIHLQGGEVSGSIDDKVRDTNTKLADFHLTTNEETKRRIISMGESENRVRVVGCPSLDLVVGTKFSFELWERTRIFGTGTQVDPEDEYGIVMFHPDTLLLEQTEQWIDSLVLTINKSPMKWFWFWPNPDHGTSLISKKLRMARESGALSQVHFTINLEPELFINLALRARIIVGNSSFGIRECSALGLPVINLGTRQDHRQKSRNVLDIRSPKDIDMNAEIEAHMRSSFEPSYLYGDGHAGARAARAIAEWKPSIKSRE